MLTESRQLRNGHDVEQIAETHIGNHLDGLELQLDTLADLDPTVPELRIHDDVEAGIDAAIACNPYDTAAISDKLDVEKK